MGFRQEFLCNFFNSYHTVGPFSPHTPRKHYFEHRQNDVDGASKQYHKKLFATLTTFAVQKMVSLVCVAYALTYRVLSADGETLKSYIKFLRRNCVSRTLNYHNIIAHQTPSSRPSQIDQSHHPSQHPHSRSVHSCGDPSLVYHQRHKNEFEIPTQ